MSLNRSIDAGKLVCLDCGSQNICYSSKDREFVFDVTTTEVRSQILNSIQDKILQYEKEISGLDTEVEGCQRQINTLMRDEPVSYTDVIIYNSEYATVADIDNKISSVDKELAEKQAELASINSVLTGNVQERKRIESNLISQMNRFRVKIGGSNSKEYDELFTKHGHPYSGSEETEFLLSRLYAYVEVLNHQYPIIVDSSRAEDLSTPRERASLELFRYIKNQVIFTTTIKEEEKGKYENIGWLNAIDYSRHETYKLLATRDLEEFKEYMRSFAIVLGL